jgi:hypothetical protein
VAIKGKPVNPIRRFFDFLAKMGLSVKDDPPKVVDVSARAWGEIRDGLSISICPVGDRNPEALPDVSVVLRNVSSDSKRLSIPDWALFYRFEVSEPDGTQVPTSPFGLALLSEPRPKLKEVLLAPGEVVEAQIPIGSLFSMRGKRSYKVHASCQPDAEHPLTSNEIVI